MSSIVNARLGASAASERLGAIIQRAHRILYLLIIFLLAAILTCAACASKASAASGNSVPIEGYQGTPPHYIGSVYCEACHEEQTLTFAQTKMGKLFLEKPDSPLAKLGCEGCHGPGSNHAISGGGVGKGGLVAFRNGADQPVDRSNQACLVCHDEAYWHGTTHGMRPVACFDCHTIMERESPHFQLSSAIAPGWSNRRTWGGVAGAGVAIGLIGAIGAIVFRRRDGGGDKKT